MSYLCEDETTTKRLGATSAIEPTFEPFADDHIVLNVVLNAQKRENMSDLIV